MKGAIKARLNHASPEKHTPFRCFALFLTPQRVFAAPRLKARPQTPLKTLVGTHHGIKPCNKVSEDARLECKEALTNFKDQKTKRNELLQEIGRAHV